MLDSYGRPNVIFSNVFQVGKLTHTVVDPVDGRTVWASFIVSYPKAYIAVTKSTDFGETWSAPSEVSPQPPNFDKDELAVKGKTVAVAYDDGLTPGFRFHLLEVSIGQYMRYSLEVTSSICPSRQGELSIHMGISFLAGIALTKHIAKKAMARHTPHGLMYLMHL